MAHLWYGIKSSTERIMIIANQGIRSDSISEAFSYLGAMFSFNRATNMEMLSFYMSKETFFALLLALLFSTRLVPYVKQNLKFNHLMKVHEKFLKMFLDFVHQKNHTDVDFCHYFQ